jgi:iron-sulfur cluster assembly protein
MRERPPIMTLSDAAAARLKALMATRADSAVLRIGVRKGGCSGMAYTMEFSNEANPMDEIVEAEGIKVAIDAKAMMFLLGTQMDYVESTLSSGFVFNNPNEKGRCGCGESFHV